MEQLDVTELPDDVVYHVCTLLLKRKQSSTDVRDWLRENGYVTASRETPNKILKWAFDREIIHFPVREDLELSMLVSRKSGVQCRISAVGDNGDMAFENIAELAADQVMDLIDQVQANGQKTEPPRDEVHIGLAAGGTSRSFANHLANKLKRAQDLPQIWLHTLTGNFFVDNPYSAPVVSLGMFQDVNPAPKYVVLESVPVVTAKDEANLRTRPFTREAFNAASDIDIVVTSVSVANHPHSMFQLAIQKENPDLADQRIDDLLNTKAWAGDILWQPFSTQGEPIECDVRAVSVVDYDDLIRLSNSPGKHVVCIAGLCTTCKLPKTEAVIPLMRCASSKRPFNHLVTTRSTVQEIQKALGW